MGGIERHVTDKAKPVAQTRLGGISIVVSDASGLLGRRHLCEQDSMVAFFNAQNIMHVVVLQHLDMRGVGTQTVFGDDQREVRVVLTQLHDQPLGCLPLTIVFLGAIVFHNGLGHQRNHFPPIGMDEGSPQHRMRIRDGAIAVVQL